MRPLRVAVSAIALLLTCLVQVPAQAPAPDPAASDLWQQFVQPSDVARPWVYWYFMDGNLSRQGMSADLQAMKQAGIGGGIYLEVGLDMPRGPVPMMSKPWQQLLGDAFAEADTLGLQLAMATGPGWCGTGGPWITPELAMQHLVASETAVTGPSRFDEALPQPPPRKPYFGEATLTPELHKQWKDFYRDVAVLAFPTPAGQARIADVEEKALYHRDAFSSMPHVKPFLTVADPAAVSPDQCVDSRQIVDLTGKLSPDGHLSWDVPPGPWTILRFGRTLTGQTTRPAPEPGLGFESDKLSKAAVDAHFDAYLETLLKNTGEPKHPGAGLTTLHFDSWEMGSQNWTPAFREEFTRRRGYDPLRFLPAMSGYVVDSADISERFLWDLRQTAQELVIDGMAELKARGAAHGLNLSIEPYDLNPCADFKLGAMADVPMGEFWANGFNAFYSCIEAASLGHTLGRPIVGAESFTAQGGESWAWQEYPGSLKEEGDWAFCCGINRITIHRYQAQPALDRFPGLTMASIGVHWERTETWWDLSSAYHLYLARCQQMLRRGLFVADVLYLAPEGAPQVFRPPASAAPGAWPDRLGYNFDGCGPDTLIERASVQDGRIVFPDGMSYSLLVLPEFKSMTPRLLQKIVALAEAGATVVGAPPQRSPSLSGYPACDAQVKQLAARLWGEGTPADSREVGKGRVIDDPEKTWKKPADPERELYPNYAVTAKILSGMGIPPDFETNGNIRYIHRRDGKTDFYFIANRVKVPQKAVCKFRVSGRHPEWWNPVTGTARDLPNFTEENGITSVPVVLEPDESGFVVFRQPGWPAGSATENFPAPVPVATLDAPWEVAFDPKWGGPEKADFPTLDDWSKRPEPGIQHYSGKAVYRTTFDAEDIARDVTWLSLGKVKDLASVKLNGKDLGILWCDPWRVAVPPGLLRAHGNDLEITVANLWVNRLIGDSGLPPDKQLTSTTYQPFTPKSPLEKSGLLGPVTLLTGGP